MPTIRPYERQERPAGPTAAGGASPGDFYQPQGDTAMERLGETLVSVGEHLDRVRRASKLTGAVIDASAEAQEYAYGLQHGTPGEGGATVPPPPAEQHNGLYAAKVKAIREKAKANLDPESYEAFEKQFSSIALRLSFDVRSNVNDRETKERLAATAEDLQTLARTAGKASDVLRPTLLNQGRLAVQTLESGGLLDAMQARNMRETFENDVFMEEIRAKIQTDPAKTREQLKAGRWDKDLDSGDRKQLISEANVEVHAREAEASRLKAEERKAKEEAQTALQNMFLEKLSRGELSPKDVLASGLDPFGSGSKETFLQLIKTAAEKPPTGFKTDPSVFLSYWQRIHAPDSDPHKLRDETELYAGLGKGLDLQNIKDLRAEVQGRRTTEGSVEADLKAKFIDVAQSVISETNPLLGIKDPEGEENLLRFMSWFLPEYERQKQAGKTPAQLLTPDSPDYLGKTIPNYVKDFEQLVKGLTSRVSEKKTKAEPRREGESPAEYLKRIGK